MPESFDPHEFARYLRSRWRFCAVACIVAVAAAAIISALLTRQYTAQTRLMIEPPAGSDPRAATAVSPVYLESLKTFEHFASSDSLFRQALEHFKIRDLSPRRSIESWKRAVLKVDIPRNTKVLEIKVTLPDPRTAHALSLYLSEQTVALNRSIARENDAEFISDLERQADGARARFEQAQSDWSRVSSKEPVEATAAEIEAEQTQRARVQEDLMSAEVMIAEDSDRENSRGSGGNAAAPAKPDAPLSALRFLRVRADALRRQRDELDRSIKRKQATLAVQKVKRDQAGALLESARKAYDALESRLREVRATVGYRGERLKIIDPGIVPERPSYPNVPLNILAALLLALTASLAYIIVRFGSAKRWDHPLRTPLRVAGKGKDG